MESDFQPSNLDHIMQNTPIVPHTVEQQSSELDTRQTPTSPISYDGKTLSESIKGLVIEHDMQSKDRTGPKESPGQVSHPTGPKDGSEKATDVPDTTDMKEDSKPQRRRQDRLSSSSKERSTQAQNIMSETIHLPRVNCKEKVVFVLNMSKELENQTFRSRSGDKFAPLRLIKRAIGIFMKNKRCVNSNHEYALIILQHTAHWAHDFTSNPDDIISYLEDLDQTFQSDTVDLASVFDTIKQKVTLPRIEEYSKLLPPPYIIRCVFIYGSSYCVPSIDNNKSQRMLQSSPHFFLDAFYIHESPSDENKCEEIYKLICSLDTKGLSYVFEVSRNPTKLYDRMAQLLPHPLQRPIQDEAHYDLEDPTECLPPLSPT